MTQPALEASTPARRHDTAYLEQRRSYRHWATDTVRWCDTDLLGHVNHLAIGAYVETGRARFMRGVERPGQVYVTASLTLNFLEELHWPDPVEIGTGLLSMGNTSLTLCQALFSNERCIATASCVLVLIDPASRAPITIDAALRNTFGEWQVSATKLCAT